MPFIALGERILKLEWTAPGIIGHCSSDIYVWTELITYRPQMSKIYFIFNHVKVTIGRKHVGQGKRRGRISKLSFISTLPFHQFWVSPNTDTVFLSAETDNKT